MRRNSKAYVNEKLSLVWRKKGILLLLVLVCIVSGITVMVYKINEVKHTRHVIANIFEEIYIAEMNALEQRGSTPLSDTEYFYAAMATDSGYNDGKFKEVIVKESPKDNALFELDITYMEYIDKSALLIGESIKSIFMNIISTFVYHGVEIKISYGFSLFSKDTSSLSDDFVSEGTLWISYTGSVDGRKLQNLAEFATFGISEAGLKERTKENLASIHNYWVDNYEHSKLQRVEAKDYHIGGGIRFDMDGDKKDNKQ
jgi:hypothetical protein